jgi:dTMP kinase
MERGRFIVIDGGDGSGKGTVIEALKAEFSSGRTVFTREPGGTSFAEEIRAMILGPSAKNADANTMFFLFLAARADHMANLIRPSLCAGKNVITDRFDASTSAFQIFAQGGHHLRGLFDVAHQVVCKDVRPYLYLYLDVDPEEGKRRTQNRGNGTHFDERNHEFHAKVRQGYIEFISTRPHRIIDANRPVEEVVKETIRVVHSALD